MAIDDRSDREDLAVDAKPAPPVVRQITADDLIEAVGAGLRDFRKAPFIGLFFGGLYAVGGWFLLYFLYAFDLPFMVYPLAAGFALVAPFVAAGVYDVSRQIEQGGSLSLSNAISAVWRRAGRDLGWMALVSTFAFLIWVDMAGILYLSFFGLNALELRVFLHEVFNTSHGLSFLFLGNLVGAVIAVIVFSVTVISFPILVDRDIDFVTAMVTSVRSVVRNPVPMLIWCAVIGLLLMMSLLSAFVGLWVVLPVLGHASWHLYRRVIEPVQES
ncbi:DUF2189 domain-containing protein [Coralliovum pocilloporae]|uniref:DUF2189 domain-containing protein n=1 Tax=Coralliovum pocilloporae TaxID=3066369 RepID=UPI003306CEBE